MPVVSQSDAAAHAVRRVVDHCVRRAPPASCFCDNLPSWRKRHHFERAFKSFNVSEVARFSEKDIDDLMAWPDGTIIRNRAKLRAVVQNARIICAMSAAAAAGATVSFHASRCFSRWRFGAGTGPSFAELLWSYCPANSSERLKTIDSISGRCRCCE